MILLVALASASEPVVADIRCDPDRQRFANYGGYLRGTWLALAGLTLFAPEVVVEVAWPRSEDEPDWAVALQVSALVHTPLIFAGALGARTALRRSGARVTPVPATLGWGMYGAAWTVATIGVAAAPPTVRAEGGWAATRIPWYLGVTGGSAQFGFNADAAAQLNRACGARAVSLQPTVGHMNRTVVLGVAGRF